MSAAPAPAPHHERIGDPRFRHAVDLLDQGDVDGLRHLLTDAPELVTQRVLFPDDDYFRNPTLLEFAAENPVRRGTLPPAIVAVARTILEAGARHDHHAVDSTLALVSSGRVPRECLVQVDLIDLLCRYGARPDAAMDAALGHGEFAAVEALLARGARLSLRVAAATGRVDEAERARSDAPATERHLALAWAAQFGHPDIVRRLLESGEDPNRFNPPGAHPHSTPLHQAAHAGHLPVVRLLLDHGARVDLRDRRWEGTPADWADHAGQAEIAVLLRTVLDRHSHPH